MLDCRRQMAVFDFLQIFSDDDKMYRCMLYWYFTDLKFFHGRIGMTFEFLFACLGEARMLQHCFFIFHFFRKIAVLVLTVLVAGCTSFVADQYADQSFNFKSLQEGGMVVGGVASAVTKLASKNADNEAARLVSSIHNLRPMLSVRTAAQADKHFSSANQAKRLEQFALGPLPPESFSGLAPLRKYGRYVVYARIETDAVSQSHGVEEVALPGTMQQVRGKKGRVYITPSYDHSAVVEVYRSTRTVGVRFSVIDLDQKREVWSGRVNKIFNTTNNVTNSISNSRYVDYRGPSASPLAGFPAPPASDTVLEAAYRGFAENLPAAPQ